MSKRKSPPPKKRGRVGRPRFVPTDIQRKLVLQMVGCGFNQESIVRFISNPETGKNIDEKTLRQHFRVELDTGADTANRAVAASIFNKATGDGPQAVTAAIWWAKCRMGWRENVKLEVDVKSGVLVVPGLLSAAEWAKAARGDGDSD